MQRVFGTVLFTDLRGYTRLSEHLEASQVATLLKELFDVLTDCVHANSGAVFHLAGDALMAGFGLQESGPAGARAALKAGKDMIAAVAARTRSWTARFGTIAGVGVGIHSGTFARVAFGPPPMRHPTLVGDTVNVASRLCQRARAGEILFSAIVAAAVTPGAYPDMLHLPAVHLKGRGASLTVSCLPAAGKRKRLDKHALTTIDPNTSKGVQAEDVRTSAH